MSGEDSSVSVVIPVRNGATYVAEAIQSCIDQTRAVQEIIVVDDGSTDATAEVVARFGNRITLLQQQWAGAGPAMNRGIDHSGGEFLAFLDHDDLWMPDKISHQLQEFRAKPTLEAVFGQVEQFITPELESRLRDRIRIPNRPQAAAQTSAMLLRRTAWYRVGPFEVEKNAFGFQSWYVRALTKSLRISMIPILVSRRRIHASNCSQLQRDGLYERYLKLAREMASHNRRNRSAHQNDE
jgi:glycosyltransferase involved in cell wall biosynthesis